MLLKKGGGGLTTRIEEENKKVHKKMTKREKNMKWYFEIADTKADEKKKRRTSDC